MRATWLALGAVLAGGGSTAPASALTPEFVAPPAMHGPVGPMIPGIGPPPFIHGPGPVHGGWEGRHDWDRLDRHDRRRRHVAGVWIGHSGWGTREVRTEDWWHDNPQRSYPRWVNRGNCERQWYRADTLVC